MYICQNNKINDSRGQGAIYINIILKFYIIRAKLFTNKQERGEDGALFIGGKMNSTSMVNEYMFTVIVTHNWQVRSTSVVQILLPPGITVYLC